VFNCVLNIHSYTAIITAILLSFVLVVYIYFGVSAAICAFPIPSEFSVESKLFSMGNSVVSRSDFLKFSLFRFTPVFGFCTLSDIGVSQSIRQFMGFVFICLVITTASFPAFIRMIMPVHVCPDFLRVCPFPYSRNLFDMFRVFMSPFASVYGFARFAVRLEAFEFTPSKIFSGGRKYLFALPAFFKPFRHIGFIYDFTVTALFRTKINILIFQFGRPNFKGVAAGSAIKFGFRHLFSPDKNPLAMLWELPRQPKPAKRVKEIINASSSIVKMDGFWLSRQLNHSIFSL
jgi:hypothetical protein